MPQAFDPGVPLAEYRQLGATVDLTCAASIHRRVLPLEDVIDRLRVRCLGGGETGIRAVAGFVGGDVPGAAAGGLRVARLVGKVRSVHEPTT